MATGRKPSGMPHSRPRSQQAKEATFTLLTDTGEIHGKALPEIADNIWHPQSVTFWEAFRSSPQAQTFTATDWEFLLQTTWLVSKMFDGDTKLASEVRLRSEKLGATAADRERLRLTVVAPEPPQTVHMDAERRRRLQALCAQ